MELGEPSFTATTEVAAHEECDTPAERTNTEKYTDEALIHKIKRSGQHIQETYCNKRPGQPTMLPPIPNNSKFIDKFPDQGLSTENEQDKRKQEAYAAEVAVYRALESLEEEVVVLHGLSHTNRQYALFKQDFTYDSEKPNKEAGECDFVILGKNYFVIIEVSDVQMDHSKTTNKRITKAFNSKKKQAERTEELINRVLLVTNPDENDQTHPPIKWFCAFLSLPRASDLKLQDDQLSRIIFKDLYSDEPGVFQSWWNENVLGKIDSSTDENTMNNVRNILIGLWNINPQNESNPEENCSLASNIMRTDRQLRDAEITNGFGRRKSGYENPNFVVADDVFQNMGIKYLTKEQESVFKNEDNFLWINGPAGSGKTMLILGKAIQTVKTDKSKVVIFKNMSEERCQRVYEKFLGDADISFNSIEANDIDGAEELAAKILSCTELQKMVLVALDNNQDSSSSYQASGAFKGLQLIRETIELVITAGIDRELSHYFLDDEQCLLYDRSFQRLELVKKFQELTSKHQTRRIWIASDIAQSLDHTAPQNLPDVLPAMDSMMQVYGELSLSRNLRNTHDISHVLSIIRQRILLSPIEESGHFLRGPKPLFYFVKTLSMERNSMVEKCRTLIKKEFSKLTSCKELKLRDITVICNTQSEMNKIILEESSDFTDFTVCNILDTYSAEWPVVILLMDVTDMADEDYTILHQLYLGLSRARVYCSAILYTPQKDNSIINHVTTLLQSLKPHGEVELFSESEGVVSSSSSSATGKSGGAVKPYTRGALLRSEISPEKPTTHFSADLHDAALWDDLDTVRHLVEAGAYINTKDSRGYTPLHWAVRKNNCDMTRYLVEAGADINMKDSRGYTPLHWAVRQNNCDMTRYLVEAGADVNVKNSSGHNPLRDAVLQDNLDMTRYLVEAGADINAKDSSGYTPLHEAVLRDNCDMTRYLVAAGADINVKNEDQNTLLKYAVDRGNEEMIRYLLEQGSQQSGKTLSRYMEEDAAFLPDTYRVVL